MLPSAANDIAAVAGESGDSRVAAEYNLGRYSRYPLEASECLGTRMKFVKKKFRATCSGAWVKARGMLPLKPSPNGSSQGVSEIGEISPEVGVVDFELLEGRLERLTLALRCARCSVALVLISEKKVVLVSMSEAFALRFDAPRATIIGALIISFSDLTIVLDLTWVCSRRTYPTR